MAPPEIVKARFFQRASDGAWLARLDTQSPLITAEAELHCAAEYGFPVRAVEVGLESAAFDLLKAQRMVNAVRPPAQPPAPLTPEQVAFAAATPDGKIAMIARKVGFLL